MAETVWSQDQFQQGEISPLMYARSDVSAYYNGLKTAENVISLPQGAAIKRFGTRNVHNLASITDYRDMRFRVFQYKNECNYLVVFRDNNIDIYLENDLVFTVATTGIRSEDMDLIDTTILDTNMRVTTGIYQPSDLERSAVAANALTGAFTSSTLTITNPYGVINYIYPARFTNTGGAFPTTSPQIKADRTYFIRMDSTTTIKIYENVIDARDDTNEFTISSGGTGTNNLYVLNNWSFNAVSFSKVPAYDFNDIDYSGYYFKVGATTGAAVTVTCTSDAAGATPQNFFWDYYIGGLVIGNGGIGRITAVGSAAPTRISTCTIAVQQAFTDTNPWSGELTFIGEPAWSDYRLWPRKCSSYQNRSVFANTDLLNNGVWCSVINDYNDFDDSVTDDDSAISWYPSSNDINYINFILPYRSLTFYSNTGVWSTPLSSDTAITPKNFSLAIQDTSSATTVQPRAIDNQVIVISGNDAHALIWDGINNAYNSTMVSVINEQVLTEPVDEAGFVDRIRAGSRYMFVTNSDGTLAMYQSLITENISGWTRAVTEQQYGNAYFRYVDASFDGRCWFVTEREVNTANLLLLINGYTAETLQTAAPGNYSTTVPTLIQFNTGGSLPAPVTDTKALTTGRWYYAMGVTASTFNVYDTYDDALSDTDKYQFMSAGSLTQVADYPLTSKFYIEELDFDLYMDDCEIYDGVATSTITGLSRFNGQEVMVNGDGYGFTGTVYNGQLEIEAHGQSVEIEYAQIGHPINVTIEPMPLSIALGNNIKTTNLVYPKRIHNVSFMFNNTVDAYINGVPVAIKQFDQVQFGNPPTPASGVFDMSIMKGWNDFKYTTYTITHSAPFDVRLLGVFYKLDV